MYAFEYTYTVLIKHMMLSICNYRIIQNDLIIVYFLHGHRKKNSLNFSNLYYCFNL